MPGVVAELAVVAADAAVACVVAVPYAEPGIDAAADKLFGLVPVAVVELHVLAAYAEPAFFAAASSVVAALASFLAEHVDCAAVGHVGLAFFAVAELADAALADYAVAVRVEPASAAVAAHADAEPAGCVAAVRVEPASSTVVGGPRCFLQPAVALELYG